MLGLTTWIEHLWTVEKAKELALETMALSVPKVGLTTMMKDGAKV